MADARAAGTAGSAITDWYKAFFWRLNAHAAFYSYPVIVIRPNWEGMNQDTGMKLANSQQWYEAGLNQTEYNAMMRQFCKAGKDWGPKNTYIVFSPAYETTYNGAMDKTYESYLTDTANQGPGTSAWVGYTGTCASLHPDSKRNTSRAAAQAIVTGAGMSASKWYWTQRAIDMTVKYSFPFFSLEHGPSVPYGNDRTHNLTKWLGDTYEALWPDLQ